MSWLSFKCLFCGLEQDMFTDQEFVKCKRCRSIHQMKQTFNDEMEISLLQKVDPDKYQPPKPAEEQEQIEKAQAASYFKKLKDDYDTFLLNFNDYVPKAKVSAHRARILIIVSLIAMPLAIVAAFLMHTIYSKDIFDILAKILFFPLFTIFFVGTVWYSIANNTLREKERKNKEYQDTIEQFNNPDKAPNDKKITSNYLKSIVSAVSFVLLFFIFIILGWVLLSVAYADNNRQFLLNAYLTICFIVSVLFYRITRSAKEISLSIAFYLNQHPEKKLLKNFLKVGTLIVIAAAFFGFIKLGFAVESISNHFTFFK